MITNSYTLKPNMELFFSLNFPLDSTWSILHPLLQNLNCLSFCDTFLYSVIRREHVNCWVRNKTGKQTWCGNFPCLVATAFYSLCYVWYLMDIWSSHFMCWACSWNENGSQCFCTGQLWGLEWRLFYLWWKELCSLIAILHSLLYREVSWVHFSFQ